MMVKLILLSKVLFWIYLFIATGAGILEGEESHHRGLSLLNSIVDGIIMGLFWPIYLISKL